MDTITDLLVRERPDPEAASVRATDTEEGRTLHGHFSVFDTWYEIDSIFEGRFLERTVAGAFEETLSRGRNHIKAQYQHGRDPWVGAAPLGPFTDLREDDRGGYYAIDLIETDYNRDRIIPQARANLLGASFRFSVPKGGEHWVDHPGKSDYNPAGLPERTIVRADVYELGPVVFGASSAATAEMRSGTDQFIDRILSDPIFLARFVERVGADRVERLIASLPPSGRGDEHPDDAAQQGAESRDTSTDSQPGADELNHDHIRFSLMRWAAMTKE